MSFYRQSIILFGFVVPTLIAAIVVGVVYGLKSNVSSSFQEKQSLFKNYETNRLNTLGIEAQISRKRQHMERWQSQLHQETASSIASNLKAITEKIPSKEFQQTAFDRPNTAGGFGSVSAQRSSQIRLAFRGTFRAMQRAFLELESRMPQLQLNELRIDPSSQGNTLNAQVTYTAWEN